MTPRHVNDITRVADEYLAAHRKRADVVESRGGWDYETDEDREIRHRHEDEWLATLRELAGSLPIGSPEWTTHGMLRHEIESSVALRAGRTELWDVNQMTGWHVMVAHVAGTIPVDTAEARDRALRRFGALPDVVRARQEDLRRGASLGYTAARHTVQRVVEQLNAMVSGTVLESAATRAADHAFAERWHVLIAREVCPALSAFRDYLAGPYMRVARETPSLSSLPNGEAAYRAEILRYTSLNLTAEQVLEGADEAMEEIDGRLVPILRRLYPGASLEEAKRALREDRRHMFSTRGEMLAHVRDVLESVKSQLPRYFDHVPDVPLLVLPMTAVEEGIGASGYYQSPEHGNPGRYVVNTAQLSSRFDATCSAIHEGYPGHHFERIYGDVRTARHPATRELQTHAFREGWAFYSEWLGRELGVYRDEADHAGYYLHFLEVWVGLVVDVLLHAGRITRNEAIELLVRRAGRLPHVAEARADRYIAAPGHVTCYMVGYREVRKLRVDAEASVGSRFDQREFHDVLLRDGPITLPMQRAKVDHWIRSRR